MTATQRWIRFEHDGTERFGTLEGPDIAVHEGDMLAGTARPTSLTLALGDVRVLMPTVPTKMIGLWNNFGALAAKLGLAKPAHPLYFFKSSNSFLASGETIRQPAGYDGRVAFEGELGIVIGKTCRGVAERDAAGVIFGYTCVNDVTAIDVLDADPSFAQWARAKSFDTFGAVGPVVATGLDPKTLTIRTTLDGQERQNIPVSDMTMKPFELVSRLSHDMTLYPGDIVACGTSLGVGRMKSGSTVEVSIDGIGALVNAFV
ncbi:MAG: fumarylacetoacetate hydrolase family protein [Vulcanimicrobiaceae bacterium]